MQDASERIADPAGALLAEKLAAFEQLLCETLAAGNDLSTAALMARRAHKMSSTVGHPFFAEIGLATTAVVTALGHTTRGHRIAAEVGRRFGLPTAYGDSGKDPSDGFTGG